MIGYIRLVVEGEIRIGAGERIRWSYYYSTWKVYSTSCESAAVATERK